MKRITILKFNRLSPKIILPLVMATIVVAALVFSSSKEFSNELMSAQSTRASDTKINASPAMKLAFAKLSAAHTDVCRDISDMAAIGMYMNNLPAGSRLQGSCCSPMDMKKYVSQINGLKAYANISQIPKDPYDVSADSAKQMLGFYDIQLTPVQQSVFNKAQSMTADKGWCCCQCWAWYTHAGLAKYLITQHSFTAQQIVAVTNLEDCCGGS